MSNPLYYFVGLALVLSYPVGIEPLAFARNPSLAGIPVPVAASLAAFVLYGASAWAVLRRPGSAGWLARAGLRVLALLLFAAIVYVFHAPLWLGSLGIEDNVLVWGLLALSPLAGLYGILAVVAARADYPRPEGGGTPAGYLRFAFQGFLGMSLVPLVFILGLALLFQRVPALGRLAFVYPLSAWGLVLGATVSLAALLPFVLRLAFAARPLAPGPARDRLERLAAAAGFRCGGLLSLGTAGLPLSNAFIVGIQPFGRYVFFTEAILSGMTPDQLECVLAHEIAHARSRHLLHYVLFSAGFALAGALAEEALVGAGPVLALAAMLGLVFLFWFALFGFVSRRFESEAVLGAARLCGGEGGRPFGGARRVAGMLAGLARLNRVPLAAGSWRHFPLLRRIRILLEADREPAAGAALERVCRRLRAAGLAFFLAGAACAAGIGVLQAGGAAARLRRWEAYERVGRGRELLARGRFEEAGRELRAGIAAGADEPHFWLWVADCERGLGRASEAEEAVGRARRGTVTDPRHRLLLER